MTDSQQEPKHRLLVGSVVAVMAATAGLGLVINQSTTPVSAKATAPSRAHVDDQLGDTTLDELADELASLGLELRIVPDDGDTPSDPTEDEGWDDWDPTEDDGDFVDDVGYDEEPLATLDVNGDRLDTSGVSPELAERANAIWERFAELIPADQRTMVSAFELMDENYGGAHVYAADDDPTKWVLGVGEGMDGAELDYVLIHEFGHLLTLKASAVPPSTAGETCPTFQLEEGCAVKSSLLNTFVQTFWPQAMQDELARIEQADSDEEYERLMIEFYEKNRDAFVTDYAASNPVEDLAEVFATFVTEDRPTGSSVADQKVQMLWTDADLVTLRDQIRSQLR